MLWNPLYNLNRCLLLSPLTIFCTKMSKLDLCTKLQPIQDDIDLATMKAKEVMKDWEDYQKLDWGFGERPAVRIMVGKIKQNLATLQEFTKLFEFKTEGE